MALLCEIIPRRNATAGQLKRLGLALDRWYGRETGGDGIAHYIDYWALQDLLNGELPQPVALRLSTTSHARDPWGHMRPRLTVEQLRTAFPEHALKRTLYLKVWGGDGFSRQRTIESLRRDIPHDLVEDILVEGRSWDLDDPG
jgi:hypothetical protein